MSVSASRPSAPQTQASPRVDHPNNEFLRFLPAVEKHAKITFRQLPEEEKEEAVAEAANTVLDMDGFAIRGSTYKDEYVDGYEGWHTEKGRGPRPLGGWWLRFGVRCTHEDGKKVRGITVEALRAQ